MYVYIYVMYIYIYTHCIYIYIYIHIYTYIYLYVCIYATKTLLFHKYYTIHFHNVFPQLWIQVREIYL